MHELSLAENLRQIIEDEAERDGFTRVRKVHLAVGSLSHVEASALQFCFDAVMLNSVAEGATLEITLVPGRGLCRHCAQESALQHLYDPCPHCQQFGLDIVAGDQLTIRSLEVI